MSNLHSINSILKNQSFSDTQHIDPSAYTYAECMAQLENCVAVVSDLKLGRSKIYAGEFGDILGLDGYSEENSIWESRILTLISEEEREEKYLAEMRFFNHIRRIPRNKRHLYYLVTHLRFNLRGNKSVNVLHRMYYRYENSGDTVRYAICLYTPSASDFKAKSMVINTLTGDCEALTDTSDNKILSRREVEVLTLIERGLTSKEIADKLCISIHTVSRHRQEIISKLQVKNSTEACRLARQLNIL